MPNEQLTRHLILATAGHVDHGKTALVKALTGTDTDRLPEEKKRGITIDLGFAHLALPGFSLGAIDVPGHEDFIRNMIAGIGAIDIALLVVAADDGWMAQTEEHLQILEYLGVQHGVVAITKSDLANSLGLTKSIRERLRDSSLGEAPIIVTSVKNNFGLEELKTALTEVCAQLPPPRDVAKPRLFVDRVFTIRGSGTVVTGTLSGGELKRGETVIVEPQNQRSRIRSLQSHSRALEIALPGTRTALNLADLSPNDIGRGSIITTLTEVSPSDVLDVQLQRSSRSTGRLRSGATLQLHFGSARFAVRVTLLDRRELLPGQQTIARLTTAEPIFAFIGDHFVLRDPSARLTIAGGMILDPDAAPIRFRAPAQCDLLRARAESPNELRVLLETQLRRDRTAETERLLLKSHFGADEINQTVNDLVAASLLVRRENFVADATWWKSLNSHAAKAIDAQHAERPNEPGLELTKLRASLGLEPAIFGHLLGDLCAENFRQEGAIIRRRRHQLSLPPQLQKAGAEIRAALAAKPFDPPSQRMLASSAQAEAALRFFFQTGEIIRLNGDVVISSSAFAEMKERIVAALSNGAVSASELRQVIGTTRRILIPLLERLDRDGLTKRDGDRRRLRNPPANKN